MENDENRVAYMTRLDDIDVVFWDDEQNFCRWIQVHAGVTGVRFSVPHYLLGSVDIINVIMREIHKQISLN